MQAAKNLSPAEDTKARTDLRAAGWIPINAKFANKCAVCGSSAPVGSMIAWNKTTSKIMHYNPCALEFLEKGGATATPNFPPPPQVSVGLGGKKAAKTTTVVASPIQPVAVPATFPAATTPAPAVTATTTKETTKAPVAAKETKNEPAAKPQQRKFSFTNIKLSDLKR